MIKALISDFSRVILFPKDPNYIGGLNDLYQQKKQEPNFTFWNTFEINTDLLKFYQSLKTKLDLYIFTTGTIQNAPELKTFLFPLFKQVFISSETSLDKSNPNSFKLLTGRIGLDPHQIFFVDDTQINISAAEVAGIRTHRFQKVSLLKQYYTDFIDPIK